MCAANWRKNSDAQRARERGRTSGASSGAGDTLSRNNRRSDAGESGIRARRQRRGDSGASLRTASGRRSGAGQSSRADRGAGARTGARRLRVEDVHVQAGGSSRRRESGRSARISATTSAGRTGAGQRSSREERHAQRGFSALTAKTSASSASDRASQTRKTSGGGSGSSGGVFSSFRDMPKLYKGILLVALAVVLCIFVRLLYLQVIKADDYRAMASTTRTVEISTTPARGTIYDRKGNVLAISVPAKTIYANPAEITDIDATAVALSLTLGETADYYRERLQAEDGVYFVYIKRQATLQEGSAVEALKLDGVYLLDDTRREYPYGQVAGQVVGLCDADGEGICGLELQYNDVLSGTAGVYVAEIGESGLPIPGGVIQQVSAQDGQDIMITIDIDMQADLEDALVKAAEEEGTEHTNGMIVDASTGDILAIASLPLFNPADTSEVAEGATTLWGISSTYEPGSTFKTVSATALLEADAMKPTDTVLAPAELPADEYTITDAEARDDEVMTLNRIIAVSSNVGISVAVRDNLGFDRLYDAILRYGFTKATGVDYPGEAEGYLSDYDDWSTVQAYNVSFGQGVSVTAMQLVRFYSALANNGVACTPHFLLTNVTTGENADFGSEEIITNKEAVAEAATVLRHVITEGTGWMANIPDYYVVGKSGTAEIFKGDAYVVGSYNRSFVGYLVDASTPIVVYFCAEEVPYVGSTAPYFKSLMNLAIERYRVVSTWDGQEVD